MTNKSVRSLLYLVGFAFTALLVGQVDMVAAKVSMILLTGFFLILFVSSQENDK